MTRTEIDERLQELETMKHRLELETHMMSKEAYERGGKAWVNFGKSMQAQSMIWSSVKQELNELYRQRAALDEADEKAHRTASLECSSSNTSSDVQAEEDPA